MKKLFSLFIFVFSLVACGQLDLHAQSDRSLDALELEQFTLPNGSGGNHVQSIVQDDYGFMWFGTQNGLHRWDGHRFKTYMHDRWDNSSISSNYVEYIYVGER